jgi:DNA gyrase/topoisomerase IV subunit B
MVAATRDNADRLLLSGTLFMAKTRIEVGRFKSIDLQGLCSSRALLFKGFDEVAPQQRRETPTDPARRKLLQLVLPEGVDAKAAVAVLVKRLLGGNPEHQFAAIGALADAMKAEALDA